MAKQFMHMIDMLARHEPPSLPIGEYLIITALAYLTYIEAKLSNIMITLITGEIVTLSDPRRIFREIVA